MRKINLLQFMRVLLRLAIVEKRSSFGREYYQAYQELYEKYYGDYSRKAVKKRATELSLELFGVDCIS